MIFKLRTRNNFCRKYQDNNCRRCLHESDDEEDLFGSFSQLSSLSTEQHKITNYHEVLDNDQTVERYKQILNFFRRVEIEDQ